MSVVGCQLGAGILNNDKEKEEHYTCVIMTNPRAACKVHGSVPQTVVNYLHLNQNQVKLSVKVTGNTKCSVDPKVFLWTGAKSLCEVTSLHTRYALYAFPLLELTTQTLCFSSIILRGQ